MRKLKEKYFLKPDNSWSIRDSGDFCHMKNELAYTNRNMDNLIMCLNYTRDKLKFRIWAIEKNETNIH